MTFEEWKAETKHPNIRSDQSLDDWIDKRLQACWTAAQFALNGEIGISANEAAKAERRKVAVEELIELCDGTDPQYEVIIRKAQG